MGKKIKQKNILAIVLAASALTIIIFFIIKFSSTHKSIDNRNQPQDIYSKTIENYGDEVIKYSTEFKLPPSYFLSLIILESSGRKIIPPRFEPHVYLLLKEVKEGKRSSYEHVIKQHLQDASDDALKNLASSWGPFQLMGYKCLLLNIKIKDIRGSDAIYWGMKWIDMTYGDELKKNNYKDAFHIHNTGKKYPRIGKPKTYDPMYVVNGLKYMTEFEKDSTLVYNTPN